MNLTLRNMSRYVLPLIAGATYLFLYIPIAILIIFSFNSAPLPYHWGGFSLHWYHELFQSPEIWIALKNTLIIAFSAVFLSLILGVLFVYWGTHSVLYKMTPLFVAGVALPEIVMAVGLLSFFSFFSVPLGAFTLIAGHTLLGLGFVIPIIRTRFLELDYRLTEASYDLGASEMQTFFKIILPLLSPALLAAGMLVFILSLDDFLIAFFCSGTYQTLSLQIFGMIRLGVSPVINALSTLLLVVSSSLVLLFCSLKISNRGF
jgi:spermidine/putrescine transport system permease protein